MTRNYRSWTAAFSCEIPSKSMACSYGRFELCPTAQSHLFMSFCRRGCHLELQSYPIALRVLERAERGPKDHRVLPEVHCLLTQYPTQFWVEIIPASHPLRLLCRAKSKIIICIVRAYLSRSSLLETPYLGGSLDPETGPPRRPSNAPYIGSPNQRE
jgi:hypothetical protein